MASPGYCCSLGPRQEPRGHETPELNDIDSLYPAFHKPSSQHDRNDPNRRLESSSQNSHATPKLTLNRLQKVETSISSQKVVNWMIDPVGTGIANWVDHKTPPQQLFHLRTPSVRSVLEADAKEFLDPEVGGVILQKAP